MKECQFRATVSLSGEPLCWVMPRHPRRAAYTTACNNSQENNRESTRRVIWCYAVRRLLCDRCRARAAAYFGVKLNGRGVKSEEP